MRDRISYRIRSVIEVLLGFSAVKEGFLAVALLKHYSARFFGRNEWKAIKALLEYKRIISIIGNGRGEGFLDHLIQSSHQANVHYNRSENKYLTAFLKTKEAGEIGREFESYGYDHLIRLKYPRDPESAGRQGDLLLLKPCFGPLEKGVVFIQYNDSIKKLCAIYDLEAMAKQYRFVIEPSTWGYQNPSFSLMMGLSTDVIIEAQYRRDFEYIEGLRSNLKPVRLGAGDWVDPYAFRSSREAGKRYDLVMIASWLSLKRHDVFFRALYEVKGDVGRVALVGYPISDRTVEDIKRESKRYKVGDLIDFHEKIPQARVAQILHESKVNIMLSRREGANRALYEGFFSDVPAIVSSSNVGVNREHINRFTGVFAEDRDLPDCIMNMLRHYRSFSPRKWALENTGYYNSNRKLNEFIKGLAASSGEVWTKDLYWKKNFTNAMYVREEDRKEADQEIAKLGKFLRV